MKYANIRPSLTTYINQQIQALQTATQGEYHE